MWTDSVTLQFVLTELIDAFPEVFKIKQLIPSLEARITPSRLTLLSDNIDRLAGTELMSDHPFPWTAKRGTLGKLKAHCVALQKSNRIPSEQSAHLEACVSKAFHAVLQAREVVAHLQISTDEKQVAGLFRLLRRLNDNMERVIEQIPPVVQLFENEETVRSFIERRQMDLRTMYDGDLVAL